ncbi:hypothetical protein MMAG44476_01205 [Mycolicibacterium mageritense DSM 44476 = CIP 104973]|uniref:Uncharacterized protein n=1 Tax=Mycolicibacterium mageritense TaxID=53462 RepID=A0ABN5YCD6_MYCME|nr:hypothetical protein [Mycolicibacterium mageritense]MBN3452924.1 hypothetical protein [Mycobacterium sp. DSM 3803]OKH62874.1 hypothetical protein EB73_26790 [Mycobacterium sp. SWH-M3]MCC9182858.1 hypothetical protein [Mycolicibacterium mageritense]TXI55136.1 MAG: hypothetical protein E6Q55_31680 [Mycolicibacterium mageritense]CDO20084.1 hypothetical protein BN978_00536 [Mycolicibacterium mageritense DSM 44476 = CIP 104973]
MQIPDVPDEVPAADAVEQQQDTARPVPDEETPVTPPDSPPLEAADPDWQEQREAVAPDPDLEEYDRESR